MTLTEATFWTKILAKVAIISIFVLVLFYYLLLLILKNNPTNQPIFKPDNACGPIPKLTIKGITYNPKAIDINIPAENDILPILPNIAYVYRIDVTGETFSTREKAMSLAKALSFNPQEFTKTDLTHYKWSDSLRYLTVDASTLNFEYSYSNWLPAIPNLELPPLQSSPLIAKNILQSLGLYSNDIKSGDTQTFAVRLDGGEREVEAIQQAHVIRIDFQKRTMALVYDSRILQNGASNANFEDFATADKSILPEEYKIFYSASRVTDNPYTGNISVYIKGDGRDIKDSLYRLIYNNWETEDRPCGTYAIISPAEALSKVKNNQAFLVHISKRGGDRLNTLDASSLKSISIFNIELAYYEPKTRSSFLQPIYIAQGDATFIDGSKGYVFFYIPAIRQ